MIVRDSVGKRIKEYRETNNLSLVELSAKTGIPPQTLNRYELEQRAPKLDMMIDMAEKLGINPLWLQGFDVSMATKKEVVQTDDLTEQERAILEFYRSAPPEVKEMIDRIVSR